MMRIQHRLAVALFAATALTAASLGAALAQSAPNLPPRPSNEPQDFLKAPRKASTLKGDFSLTAIGDLLYSRPMVDSTDQEFQKVAALIKKADVTISNQEGVFIDLSTFKGEGYGNGLLWGEGTLAKDIKAMGVDMVAVANNHSTDFGPEGLLEAQRNLDEAGVIHAGGGANLKEARAPAYFDSGKGKVALIATASTFKPNAGANDAFGEVNARPGISILRTRKINNVTPAQFETIRKLATELASGRQPAPEPGADEIVFREEIYRPADKVHLTYDMDLFDHAAILKSVREAKENSDLVVFTIHAHESTTGMDDDTPPPPNFLIKLFHDVVDAGGDVIIGGGPHSLRGIEIYKGQPVFYGMGVFFIKGEIKALQESALRVWPDRTGHAPKPKPEEISVRPGGNPASWYDSVVATAEFKDGQAKVIRLYPLDVGNTTVRPRRGTPHFADPANAKRILANLQRDSAQFGTKIAIEGSVGVIRIP